MVRQLVMWLHVYMLSVRHTNWWGKTLVPQVIGIWSTGAGPLETEPRAHWVQIRYASVPCISYILIAFRPYFCEHTHAKTCQNCIWYNLVNASMSKSVWGSTASICRWNHLRMLCVSKFVIISFTSSLLGYIYGSVRIFKLLLVHFEAKCFRGQRSTMASRLAAAVKVGIQTSRQKIFRW